MVGMPKIPSSEEIASLTKQAMAPMAEDISAIASDISSIASTLNANLLRMIALQEQAIRLMGHEPVSPLAKPSCNGHAVSGSSLARSRTS
jgi:hypothetical protein